MTNIQIALKYFEVSNVSNFEEIEKLFHENITYSSQNTGLYLWIPDIIEMQKKLWIVRVDFEFIWLKPWEEIRFSWIEYIIVVDGKIQHIEIRNK